MKGGNQEPINIVDNIAGKITDPLTKKINEIIPLNDLKSANEQFKETIKQIATTPKSISETLQKQATYLKASMEKIIPDLNATNAELSKSLENLLQKVDDLQQQNPNANTDTTLGEVKVINEFEADNAALVVITKDMILTQLYMNYLKYFKSILVLIRDNILPNYNDIQQVKKENKEIIDQLEEVFNDPEIQEKWNIVLKTVAVQLSRFIFIVVMFSDILMQKLGDVGNRFIVQFVNQNSDAMIRIIGNLLKEVPGVASVDSVVRTLDSILNLGLITSYSLVDSIRIPVDGILRGKFFDELQKTKEHTTNTVDNLVKLINDKRENKKPSIPSSVPVEKPAPPAEKPAPTEEKPAPPVEGKVGKGKKMKQRKQKNKSRKQSKKKKKYKQKKTKKKKN